jgi:phage FluMu protein Com
MPITVRCPQCQRLLSGPQRKAGQQVDCPGCKTAVILPSTGPTAVFTSDDADDYPRAGPSWRGMGMAAWVLLLALAGLGGVYAAHWLLQETRQPVELEPVRERSAAPPVKQAEAERPSVPASEIPAKIEPMPPAADVEPPTPPLQRNNAPAAPPAAKPEARNERPSNSELSATPDSQARKLVVKRRKDTTEEDLRKQLLDVPEVLLDPGWIPGADRASILATLPTTNQLYVVSVEKDLVGHLPGLRADAAGQLGPDPARELEALSRRLRAALQSSMLADKRIDADLLRSIMLQEKPKDWQKPEAIPALQQLLMAESKPLRLLLVEFLSQIEGKEASVALAQRALFDLSPQVREAAIKALQNRPAESYRPTLLDGFRYPWPPVADHAAEALVALRDEASVPSLVELLKDSDPRLVTPGPGVKGKPGFPDTKPRVVEVVKVNHLANCMLCHKTSESEQHPVRGSVPVPGRTLETKNGVFSPYEGTSTSTFIRADITRLKQDMSVLQPVANPGQWPPHQRFDYLLRTRPVRSDEKPGLTRTKPGPDGKPEPVNLQRDSVLFALRELTGKDLGTGHGQWAALVKRQVGE